MPIRILVKVPRSRRQQPACWVWLFLRACYAGMRGHSAQPRPPGCRPCIGDDGTGATDTIRHTAQFHYVDPTPPARAAHAHAHSAHVWCGSRLVRSVMRSWMCDWQARVEELAGANFNSCLLNLSRDGGDHMGWHSDNEPLYGPEPVIGAPRQRLAFLDTVVSLLSTNTVHVRLVPSGLHRCSQNALGSEAGSARARWWCRV